MRKIRKSNEWNSEVETMENVLSVVDGQTRHPMYRMVEPINFCLCKYEQLVIVGNNASGKSLFVDTLLGRYPLLQNEVHYHFPEGSSKLVSDNIKYITFRDSYGDSCTTSYYQQRWNMMEQEDIPLVRELLPSEPNGELKEKLFTLLGIDELLDKPIIQLSSGEMRKFQLVKVLLTHPHLLVIDNPFIGLDEATRSMLQELLGRLVLETGLQVILVLTKYDEIPDFITHVLPIDQRSISIKVTRETFSQLVKTKTFRNSCPVLSEDKRLRILKLKDSNVPLEADEIVRFNQVTINYGKRTILSHIDWIVRRGERWALTGQNGSGKSTLLSLVCADNPQSYACDISLFGRRRGTGESIWEIKKRIGYVSPEMHRSYMKNLPAIDIVMSGLYDSIGLYKKVHDEDSAICRWWMDIFGIEALAERNFLQLSSGEQRMVLLARAFVKDPALLVLDEPMHGLDLYHCQLVKEIIETFCKREGKTLIMVTHYQEELPSNITNRLNLTKTC